MIRNTRQKKVIESVILASGRPLTPNEIHELAVAECTGLGLRTVYRYLKELVSLNRIVGVDFPGQPARYEMADNKGNRAHLVCRKCDRVFPLLGIADPKIEYPKVDGVRIEGHEIVYFGYCEDCAAEGD